MTDLTPPREIPYDWHPSKRVHATATSLRHSKFQYKVIFKDTGEEVPLCTEVNIQKGWAIIYFTDPDGQIVLDPYTKEPKTVKIFGDFQILKRRRRPDVSTA